MIIVIIIITVIITIIIMKKQACYRNKPEINKLAGVTTKKQTCVSTDRKQTC
jgi:hypothetical protein